MQRSPHSVAIRVTRIVVFVPLLGLVLVSAAVCPTVSAQSADVTEKKDRFLPLREIAEKYKIEVATTDLGFPIKTLHGLIEGKEATRGALENYQRTLSAELNRYPLSLVQISKIARIVLCEDLSFDGQRRNAIPDFEHDVLYLDVERGDYNQLYQRKVIHHEFFHLIDYKDDGSVYTDNAWAALNPSTFKYGAGGRSAQSDASTSILTDRFPGFLNHYSTTGVEEDKAEIFANMIVDPKHVESRAKADPVIKSKVLAMKALLEKFCPEVNEEFWKTDK